MYIKDIMKKKYALEISKWKYTNEYSEYNLPNYNEMKRLNYGMTKEDNKNNYVVYIKDDVIEAYTNIKKINDQLFFGIGLNPSICGKGMSQYFLSDFLNNCKEDIVFLEVRDWNKRAIKAYEKVGFKIVEEVIKKDRNNNETKFIKMKYERGV